MRILQHIPLVVALLLPGLAWGEMREFEDSFGRIIKAALVSHSGAGADSVKIKKSDGKEYDVKISLFSAKDQAEIRDWMKATPPTINYAFRIEAVKQKTGTSTATAYDVEVTNLARDTVKGLLVKTRAIYEYYYVPSGPNFYGYGGRLVGIEEEFKIGGEMKFNQTAKFSTTSRYNLLGLMVRVLNSEGELVGEKKLGSTKLGSLNWDDGKRREGGGSPFAPPPGGGGKTTITLD